MIEFVLQKYERMAEECREKLEVNRTKREDYKTEKSKNFCGRLVETRKSVGLTQKCLAEMLNITPTRLNLWEKGKRSPSIFMIREIAKKLGVSADYLLCLIDVPTCDVQIRRDYYAILVERHALLNMFVMELKNLKSILQLLDSLPDKEEKR